VKARKSARGNAARMFSAKLVVLAPVRFVGQHDHIGPVAQQFGSLELVDQREDVAMVLAEELPQLCAALRVAPIRFPFR
jgi:hypothetical protein